MPVDYKAESQVKEAIKEIDFGGLFHLLANMLLCKLAAWLVHNFDTCCCSLLLMHSMVRVIKKDVYRTLGLLKGPLKAIDIENKINGSVKFKSLLEH